MPSLWSPDAYLLASRFAATAHHGQLVPGTPLPYLLHVARVAAEVMAALAAEPGYDGDLAVQCALLHDVVEDTPFGPADVERAFGPRVAAGVLALSKDEALPAAEQMADSLARIRQQPAEVWMVKLADRIVNLGEPPSAWALEKRERYRAEAQQIYDALAAASPTLAERLRARIAGYERYFAPEYLPL
jgi:(p)ppGpp synthase/HD superfamily hydrolase